MNKKGFTTIELLVASSILIILGTGIVSLQYFITQSQLSATTNYLNISETNQALTKIVRELRFMQTSESGAHPLEVAQDNEIIFYSDIDFDNTIEKVRYTLNSNTLQKGIIEPSGSPATYLESNETTKTVSENIYNNGEPLFTYYNQNWPVELTNNPLPEYLRISETTIVRIYINLNTNPNLKRQEYILESSVHPRILNANL